MTRNASNLIPAAPSRSPTEPADSLQIVASGETAQLLVTTEEAAIAAQKHLDSQLALKTRRLAITMERARALERTLAEKESMLVEKVRVVVERERALTEQVRRLGLQLEHQKRATATVQARLRQAQIRLKQQQKGLRPELGRAVEKSLAPPLGALRLPFRIAKAYRRARQRAEAELLAPFLWVRAQTA
jgi:hypothetical protein